MSLFRIDMLPGREGDCLWIAYGDPKAPNRILIDGGRQIAYETLKKRFKALPTTQRSFDLLILTHVDADHIEGLLKLIADPDLPINFEDVWFNGHRHLPAPPGELHATGARQGEIFSTGLQTRGWPWNDAFGGGSIVVPNSGTLPTSVLAGGMKLTLLSPNIDALTKLRPKWERECRRAGLIPGEPIDFATAARVVKEPEPLDIEKVKTLAESPFDGDDSVTNASSIAVLMEFDGRSAVLTGDAHVDVLLDSLARVPSANRSVNALKLSHHGSKGTHSKALLETISAKKYLISTDGSRHGHPDAEAIARTVVFGGDSFDLVFNYNSRFNETWNDAALKTEFGYQTAYPADGTDGISIML